MYRPSMYDKHDETMNKFANLFNSCEVSKNIEMRPHPRETFGNDGVFIDIETNESIGFDWEYRDRYFENCKLEFPSLGQYERKLRKDSIQIALQCDKTETGVAVGWHKDWLKEVPQKVFLKTDSEARQYGGTRYTEKFKIYSYKEISEFKKMVAYAMKTKTYEYKIMEEVPEKK